MAYESHERNIIERIAIKVNPPITPEPPEGHCPKFSTGHGYWQYNSYERKAYNDFNTIRISDLEEMYDGIIQRMQDIHQVSSPPFGDIRGEEDDFMWRQVLVRGEKVLIAVRRRQDNWYDFCLIVFATHKGGPDDIS